MAAPHTGSFVRCDCGGVPIGSPARGRGSLFAVSVLPMHGAKTPMTGATTMHFVGRPMNQATGFGATDRLYDIIIEIDHNTRPRIAGLGSAVFIHVARPGFAPTAGCVALRPRDLQMLASRLGPKSRIVIHS